MKVLRSSLMALALFSLAALWSCGDEEGTDPLSFADRLAGTWRITDVRVNGTTDAAATSSGFTVTFSANGTFSVNPGTLEFKPNADVADSGGNWSANSSGTSITFTDNNSNSSSITLSNASPADETEPLTSVTVSFNADVNKTSAAIQIDFVKS